MEEYIDEEILDLIKEFGDDEKGKYGKVGSIEHKIIKDVEKGKVVIEDEIIEFEEKILLDDKVKVLIPTMFESMSNEEKSQIIFKNEDDSINIKLSYTKEILDDSQLKERKDEMLDLVIEEHPEAKLFENGIRYTNERKIGFYDFLISISDNEIYNLVFLTVLEGRTLMCTFNCLKEDMDIWQPISRGIMNSIKIKENS